MNAEILWSISRTGLLVVGAAATVRHLLRVREISRLRLQYLFSQSDYWSSRKYRHG